MTVMSVGYWQPLNWERFMKVSQCGDTLFQGVN